MNEPSLCNLGLLTMNDLSLAMNWKFRNRVGTVNIPGNFSLKECSDVCEISNGVIVDDMANEDLICQL